MTSAVLERPVKETFRLRGPQAELYWDNRRFIYYKGGRGVGKTLGACMHIGGMIMRGQIKPGARILVMGPSYPQMKKGTLASFDRWLGKDGMDLILEKIDGNEPERRMVNGIVAYFRNASNPDQTRGHEVQIIWLDEAAQMNDDVLRLTNASARQFGNNAIYQTILTSTPRGKNWLWKKFVNPETKMDDDAMGFYHITTPEAEAIGICRTGYTAELEVDYPPGSAMHRQEILGEEVAFVGNVFHYDPKRDSPQPFIVPTFKSIVGGIDIGTTAPTAVILVGIDQQGRYWVFREYYQRRANVHEVLKLIGEWDREFHVKRWSIDAAANLEAKMMRSAGFRVSNSLKAKDAAGTTVNFINSLMERDMFRVSPDCPALIMEMQSYEHKEIQSGDEVTFLDKVKPNQPDHAIDALRYAIAPLSNIGAQQQYGKAVGFHIN